MQSKWMLCNTTWHTTVNRIHLKNNNLILKSDSHGHFREQVSNYKYVCGLTQSRQWDVLATCKPADTVVHWVPRLFEGSLSHL